LQNLVNKQDWAVSLASEIVACTLGTRGDILPFLALCQPFVKSGCKVTVLTNGNWRGLVEDIGAEFHEIADPDPPQNARDDAGFYRTNTFPSFARSFSLIREKVTRNPNCLLIYRANMLGAECAAEKFRLPSVKVALQPSAINSVERPPWPLTSWVQGPFAALARNVVIPAVYKFGEAATQYRKYTNMFRREVGLAKVAFGRKTDIEDLLLVLCPEWFAMPQKDWPASSRLSGFLYFDGDGQDEELEHFVASHGAPLVFTPGTGVSDAGNFFGMAAAVCHKLAMPAVFVSPALRRARISAPDGVLIRDYAEFHHLLPRSRMLVHHGGIGSTAQAIRAGVPQLVLPDRFDQPDNAMRIALLGLGGAIFSKKPGVEEIAGLIEAVLASPAVRKQVQDAAALVRAHPSHEIAHRMIRGLMDKRFGPSAAHLH
jgi:rhamnosyltransferase subunit B